MPPKRVGFAEKNNNNSGPPSKKTRRNNNNNENSRMNVNRFNTSSESTYGLGGNTSRESSVVMGGRNNNNSNNNSGNSGNSNNSIEQQISRIMNAYNLKLNSENVRNKYTPLHKAVTSGKTNAAEAILNISKKYLNKGNDEGETPLHKAIDKNDIKTIKLLIKRGANVNIQDKSKRTPLHRAVEKVLVEVVKVLVDAPGIDVDKENRYGETPLYVASGYGHTKVVKALVAAPGIDVNRADKKGRTPLHMASNRGRTEVVKELLAAPGIDVNKAENEFSTTPLFTASVRGRTEVVKLLVDAPGIDVNKADRGEEWTPLNRASYFGRTEVVKVLVAARGIKINKADRQGWSPLFWASREGHTEVVKVLLNKGADVNQADKEGITPILTASFKGHTEVVKVLLNHPDLKIKKDEHLLKIIKESNPEILKLIISHTTINPTNKINGQSIKLILYNKLLLNNNGVNPNHVINNKGRTLLHLASRNGLTNVVKDLLNKRADFNKANKKGYTPLLIASYGGHTEVVKLLLNKGADVKKANEEGETPLHFASYGGHTEVVKLLLNKRADVNKAENAGYTPLLMATVKGHTEVVNLLLNKGADVNKASKEGITPILTASFKGHLEVVKVLIQHPKLKIKKDEHLLRIIKKSNPEILKLILSHPSIKLTNKINGQSIGNFINVHRTKNEVLSIKIKGKTIWQAFANGNLKPENFEKNAGLKRYLISEAMKKGNDNRVRQLINMGNLPYNNDMKKLINQLPNLASRVKYTRMFTGKEPLKINKGQSSKNNRTSLSPSTPQKTKNNRTSLSPRTPPAPSPESQKRMILASNQSPSHLHTPFPYKLKEPQKIKEGRRPITGPILNRLTLSGGIPRNLRPKLNINPLKDPNPLNSMKIEKPTYNKNTDIYTRFEKFVQANPLRYNLFKDGSMLVLIGSRPIIYQFGKYSNNFIKGDDFDFVYYYEYGKTFHRKNIIIKKLPETLEKLNNFFIPYIKLFLETLNRKYELKVHYSINGVKHNSINKVRNLKLNEIPLQNKLLRRRYIGTVGYNLIDDKRNSVEFIDVALIIHRDINNRDIEYHNGFSIFTKKANLIRSLSSILIISDPKTGVTNKKFGYKLRNYMLVLSILMKENNTNKSLKSLAEFFNKELKNKNRNAIYKNSQKLVNFLSYEGSPYPKLVNEYLKIKLNS